MTEKPTSEKFISLPEPEENAPEVVPPDDPQAFNIEHKISIGEVSQAQSTLFSDKEVGEKPTQNEKSRRRKWMWVFVGIAVAVVVAIALGVGLGVHYGTKGDHGGNDIAAPADNTASAPVTSGTVTPTTRPTSTITATRVQATEDPTHDGDNSPGAQGCLEQADKNQTAICVALPNLCPMGYKSVFWNWGCPDGVSSEWRCCV